LVVELEGYGTGGVGDEEAESLLLVVYVGGDFSVSVIEVTL